MKQAKRVKMKCFYMVKKLFFAVCIYTFRNNSKLFCHFYLRSMCVSSCITDIYKSLKQSHMNLHISFGLPFCQPMVQQGEEGEAEEGGEDERGGVRLNKYGLERLPYPWAEIEAKNGYAYEGDSNDGDDGNKVLAPFGFHLFTVDAAHGGICEVGRQVPRLHRSEGPTECIICLFHVSSKDKVCGVCDEGALRWFLPPRRGCRRCRPATAHRNKRGL